MLTVHHYERIRHAYYVDKKSIRQIGREYGHGYWTVRKALGQSEPPPYHLREAKAAPVLGPYKLDFIHLCSKCKGVRQADEKCPWNLYNISIAG
jgi:hypothetical protein